MKYSLQKLFIVLFVVLCPKIYSQSIGLSMGTSYYYIIKDNNYKNLEKPFNTVLIRYNHKVLKNFQVSLISGYGWNNYNFNTTGSNLQFIWTNKYEVHSGGFPVEFEFQFQHYVSADSIFAPNLGIGLGYCDFKSTIDYLSPSVSSNTKSDLRTKGFSQFLELGMKVRVTNKFSGFIELKKLLFSNIKTRGNLQALGYPSSNEFTEDYQTTNGFSDVGLTFGVIFKL